jgi:hypothetical protein
MKYVNKPRKVGANIAKRMPDLIELFGRAFPSHGRGRRFNPYSARQPSLLRSYGAGHLPRSAYASRN